MEGSPTHRPAGQGPLPQLEKRRNWRQWAIWAVIALLALFVLLNLDSVKVNFIVGETKTPLIFALLIAAALGALVGWLLPVVRRGRQHRD